MPPERVARRAEAKRAATQVELMAYALDAAPGSASAQTSATDIEVRGYGPASSQGADPLQLQLDLPAADNDTDELRGSRHAIERSFTPLICFGMLYILNITG